MGAQQHSLDARQNAINDGAVSIANQEQTKISTVVPLAPTRFANAADGVNPEQPGLSKREDH